MEFHNLCSTISMGDDDRDILRYKARLSCHAYTACETCYSIALPGCWPASVSILTSVPGFFHLYETVATRMKDYKFR